MVTVIDYDSGNLRSVETALQHLRAPYRVSSEPETVAGADKIIFPGVGEAAQAMGVLKDRGLNQALAQAHKAGIPILGICIGAQILLDRSMEAVEGTTPCLGLMQGSARDFTADFRDRGIQGLKVPHMGWNQVSVRDSHPHARLFDGIAENSSFYFVHSYYPAPDEDSVALSETDYGFRFVSAYGKDNLVATQFHPEKSGPVGLRLLANFIDRFGE